MAWRRFLIALTVGSFAGAAMAQSGSSADYITAASTLPVEDEVRITGIIARMNHAIDQNDYPLYASFYAEDGVIDFGLRTAGRGARSDHRLARPVRPFHLEQAPCRHEPCDLRAGRYGNRDLLSGGCRTSGRTDPGRDGDDHRHLCAWSRGLAGQAARDTDGPGDPCNTAAVTARVAPTEAAGMRCPVNERDAMHAYPCRSQTRSMNWRNDWCAP